MLKHALFALTSATLLAGCASSTSRAGSSAQESSEEKAPPASQARLPDFTLETIEGDTFTLSDHVGEDVIVMSFWATWCRPCLAELPHLDALYQAEKDNGLVVVAISMDEPSTVAEVAPMANRLGLTMPVVVDADQRAVSLFNRSRNAPMTVVINRAGEVVRASAGYNPGDEEALAEQVRGLLAE